MFFSTHKTNNSIDSHSHEDEDHLRHGDPDRYLLETELKRYDTVRETWPRTVADETRSAKPSSILLDHVLAKQFFPPIEQRRTSLHTITDAHLHHRADETTDKISTSNWEHVRAGRKGADTSSDWVHDRYDDEPSRKSTAIPIFTPTLTKPARDDHSSRHRSRRDDQDYDIRTSRRSPTRDRWAAQPHQVAHNILSHSRPPPPPAKIRIDNLHWDLSEDDLYVCRACIKFGTAKY